MARSEPYRDVLAGVFRKALCHRFATPKQQACQGPIIRPRQDRPKSGLLYNHATAHLHMQRMTEPVAVVPVHPGTIRLEGH